MERTTDDNKLHDATTTIDLDGLSNQDQISVRTATSRYQFSVQDSSNRKGILTGGRVGNQRVQAVCTGSVSDDRESFDAHRLTTGSRAVFFVIESKNRIRRVVTSVVTEIAIINRSLGGRYAA
jgi:hypothetical protein